jgi:hypothetical protein
MRDLQTLNLKAGIVRHLPTPPQTTILPMPSVPAKPACEACGDLGWYTLNVPFGHPKFSKHYRCECKAVEDAVKLQALCGLESAERAITLEDIILDGSNPATANMVAHVQRFNANPIGFLTIHGSTGNAKTLALKAAVNFAIAHGQGAVYTTFTRLLAYIRQAYTHDREHNDIRIASEQDYDRLMKLCQVQVLAIDEFDPLKVKQSEWVNQIESDLIDTRWTLGEYGKVGTLLAMNGAPALFPPWIESRLRQWPIILNDDPDMRPLLKRAQ